MAVEAKHLNLLTPQPIQNSEQRQMHFSGIPVAGTSPEKQMNFYQAVVCEAKTSDRDSGVTTYNNLITRKRSRNEFYAAAPNLRKDNSVSNISSYVGDDFFRQYHLDIDTIISQHTKKIRMELQERQKQQTRLLVAAIGEGAMKKLKEKDEEIQKLGKLNYVLQERVKSVYVENQVWREVAQTNEAAANNLRCCAPTSNKPWRRTLEATAAAPPPRRTTWSPAVGAAIMMVRRIRILLATTVRGGGGAGSVANESRVYCCYRAGTCACATFAGAGPTSSERAPCVTLA